VSWRDPEQMVRDAHVNPKKANHSSRERGPCPHDLSGRSFLGNLTGVGGKGLQWTPQGVGLQRAGCLRRKSGQVQFPSLL